MKKTNGSSRTNPHNRNITETWATRPAGGEDGLQGHAGPKSWSRSTQARKARSKQRAEASSSLLERSRGGEQGAGGWERSSGERGEGLTGIQRKEAARGSAVLDLAAGLARGGAGRSCRVEWGLMQRSKATGLRGIGRHNSSGQGPETKRRGPERR